MSLADTAESWLAAHFDDLVAWRRHIHRYPELGRQEYATTQFVAERLADAGLNPTVLPGGSGLTWVSPIFALHCDPRLAVGKIAVKAGPITSAADMIEITLYSPGGHTSRPHLTADLVYGLGTLITGLPGVLSPRLDPPN